MAARSRSTAPSARAPGSPSPCSATPSPPRPRRHSGAAQLSLRQVADEIGTAHDPARLRDAGEMRRVSQKRTERPAGTAELAAAIRVNYRFVDGYHIYTSEDVYGLYVANRDATKAYAAVGPSLEKLIQLNEGISCRVEPGLTFSALGS